MARSVKTAHYLSVGWWSSLMKLVDHVVRPQR
jgi:hypothetical protein